MWFSVYMGFSWFNYGSFCNYLWVALHLPHFTLGHRCRIHDGLNPPCSAERRVENQPFVEDFPGGAIVFMDFPHLIVNGITLG